MSQQDPPATLPIEAKFIWSADELTNGVKMHLRHNLKVLRFMFYLGGFMVLVCCVTAFLGKQIFMAGIPWGILGTFFLCLNSVICWQTRRQFQSNPHKNVQMSWIFTDDKFCSKGEGFDFSLAWNKVFKLIDSPKGFLIYPQKQLFYWIPASSFASESEVERVREIAKSKVTAYKRVG